MKKLFILSAILLPLTSFGYATEELDTIFLSRETGYAPYESLKQTYREVCVEPRLREEAEIKELSLNKSGMLRDAFQSQIGAVYAKYDDKACEAVVSRLNVAYAEYLNQPKQIEKPIVQSSNNQDQIIALQQQVEALMAILIQLIALQSK